MFSDYVIDMKHAYWSIHYCGDDKSVSPTSSLKPKTKKALVYQEMINVNAASLLFFPDTFINITSASVLWRAWVLIRLRRQLKAHIYDLNGLLINVRLVD